MSRTAAGRNVRQPTDGTTIMMRSTLIAAVLGMLAAGPAVYILTAPARQDPAAAPPGADSAVAEAAIPVEAWAICSWLVFSCASIVDIWSRLAAS